ncbi:MAG: transketolase [Deltaproteobacteria bacterium]|nr:transketolase [Deltaproteobacteria bacterium]MBW2323110.1 transketolase [Deltaproteobacteria bacterium]
MKDLDDLCVNTIRMLSADCVEKAQSGHPGMPMGASSMAYVLWTRFLSHNPLNPGWPNRDRFVLSAGHGSMLLYSLLHLTGYDLPLEELLNFRQWGSKTPGHPEYQHTPGVETTTGPLGQGFGNGVGMAIAERYLAAKFNRPGHEIINHFIYGIVSDGDLMEGVTHEAASLAGHLKLGKLIYLYDDNHISIEGPTDLAFTENRAARFEAYEWHVQQVEDGNDLKAIEKAITNAQKETERPSLIAVRTHIGYGSPNKQDKASAHGEPLGADEIKLTKENLRWPLDPAFHIPDEALNHFRQAIEQGKESENQWKALFSAYKEAYPEEGAAWENLINGGLPDDWEKDIPVFEPDSKGIATRVASGKVLNAVAPYLPNLIGGSADLAPSNKTMVQGADTFQNDNGGGRNFHFGVREHGMGSVLNGMALYGGLIPYGGTFLVFSDYMRPPIRLAALMGLHIIYVFTHDSIGLGEDGPTHQPIEQLSALRAIPNLTVIRPCDANETAEAWRFAINHKDGPTALALTRQNVPTLDGNVFASADNLNRGAYVLSDAKNQKPDAILIASGSEVHIANEAAQKLEQADISTRVVSMPSWELFEQQPEDYQKKVLPPDVKAKIAVEAGIPLGWHRYVGEAGKVIGIDHFGASAPYLVIYEKFGITADHIVEETLRVIKDLT